MKKLYILILAVSASIVSVSAKEQTVQHTIKSGETLYAIAHSHHTTIEEVRKANSLEKGALLKLGQVLTVPVDTYVIPAKKLKTTAIKTVKHTVISGDTLYSIAHANHTSIAEVCKSNDFKYNAILKLGQVLTVPVDTYSPALNTTKTPTKLAKVETKKVLKKEKTVKKAKIVKKAKTVKKIKLTQKKVVKTKKVKFVKIKKRVKSHKKLVKHKVKSGDTLYTIAHDNKLTIKELQKFNALKYNDVLKIGQTLQLKAPKFTIAKKKKKAKLKFTKAKTRGTKRSKITKVAKTKLGKRYVWGASGTRNTYDCSSFTKYVYRKNGINIPRTSFNQSKYGKYVRRGNLKVGDLIFFDTSKRRKGYVNHVGIYLGNGKFIHASSAKKRVVITSLNKRFYSQRYRGARRPS